MSETKKDLNIKTVTITNVIDCTPIKTMEDLNKSMQENPMAVSFFAPEIIDANVMKLELAFIARENGQIVPYYKKTFGQKKIS